MVASVTGRIYDVNIRDGSCRLICDSNEENSVLSITNDGQRVVYVEMDFDCKSQQFNISLVSVTKMQRCLTLKREMKFGQQTRVLSRALLQHPMGVFTQVHLTGASF